MQKPLAAGDRAARIIAIAYTVCAVSVHALPLHN